MTQDHTTEAPVCYRHPDRNTLLRCSRCGRPICSSCSVDAAVGQRCPECLREEGVQNVERVTPPPVASRQGRAALRARAPATMSIIAVTVLFYLATSFGQYGQELFNAMAQSNQMVADGEWWRIFTAALLHWSFTHIFLNMWALWVLGPQIERGVGTWPFVALYVAAAGAGGVAEYFIGGATDVAAGASGAIFGLFGVWLSWALHRRNTAYGRAMLNQLLVLLVINAALPFVFSGIGWEAHVGGFIAGFAIAEAWALIQGPRALAMRTGIAAAVAVLSAAAVIV